MKHDFGAFEDLPEIRPKFIFLQLFAFVVEAVIDQKKAGNGVADGVDSFISSGGSPPLVFFD